MIERPEYHFAKIEPYRLDAYISRKDGLWSAAVYSLDKEEYSWKYEPLPPHQNCEESAKREATVQAAGRLGKSPDELSPDWHRSKLSPH